MKLNEIRYYTVDEVEIQKHYVKLLKEIEKHKLDFKITTHHKITTYITKHFKKEGLQLFFKKLPPENGIGNNWAAEIVGNLLSKLIQE